MDLNFFDFASSAEPIYCWKLPTFCNRRLIVSQSVESVTKRQAFQLLTQPLWSISAWHLVECARFYLFCPLWYSASCCLCCFSILPGKQSTIFLFLASYLRLLSQQKTVSLAPKGSSYLQHSTTKNNLWFWCSSLRPISFHEEKIHYLFSPPTWIRSITKTPITYANLKRSYTRLCVYPWH